MLRLSGILLAAALLVSSGPAYSQSKVVEWRYVTSLTKNSSYQTPIDMAFERIKQRTNGGLVIKTFYAGELPYKQPEFLRIQTEGKVDMALLVNSTLEGFPLAAASSLPFLSPNGTFEEQQAISDAIAQKVQDKLQKNFNAKLLMRFWWPPQIIFANVPVAKIGDVKNLKIRATGREMTEAMSAVGASSIALDGTEVYQALGRKVVDGAVTSATNFLDYKMYEVAKYAYTQPLYYLENSVSVSDKSWNEIPKEMQDIVSEEMTKAGEELTNLSKKDENSLKVLRTEDGVTVADPPAGERAQIRKLMVPIWESWAARNGADGKEALAILYQVLGGPPAK
jgi:TRAP-type transport system periplasmic protein